jgi:hypothetical protein
MNTQGERFLIEHKGEKHQTIPPGTQGYTINLQQVEDCADSSIADVGLSPQSTDTEYSGNSLRRTTSAP